MKKTITSEIEFTTLLHNVVASAQKRIVLYSPELDEKAIHANNFYERLIDAHSRRVQVVVITDDYKNRDSEGRVKISAKRAVELLKRAGVIVRIGHPVEYSLLISDENLIAGSKGVSYLTPDFGDQVAIKLYEGEEAASLIAKEKDKLERMKFRFEDAKVNQNIADTYDPGASARRSMMRNAAGLPPLTGRDWGYYVEPLYGSSFMPD